MRGLSKVTISRGGVKIGLKIIRLIMIMLVGILDGVIWPDIVLVEPVGWVNGQTIMEACCRPGLVGGVGLSKWVMGGLGKGAVIIADIELVINVQRE